MISFCPQEDILVPDLTVLEHLELFADLKNVKEKAALLEEKAKATSITDILDLKVCTLSEGQKRKVSICIALLGEAKFVILDEPTCNLDINSRQMVWEAISEIQANSNASFLISTQHLEEAEYLSSLICIIKDG